MIDPTAIIDPGAELADDVSVGPYTIIGPDVEIGAGTTVGPHAVIRGPARIGRRNRIFQFATVGEEPQDMSYAGEPTWLEIGDDNVIREYVTVHRGTARGHGVTRIGTNNYFMAYAHIAHDCAIGDHTLFANCASLGGHVHVGDHAILAGFAIVHQFCRVGAHSFCGAGAVITRDVPPYVMVAGRDPKPHGLNTTGLKRRGFTSAQIRNLRRAYRILYQSNLKLKAAIEQLDALGADNAEVGVLADFLRHSQRSIIR